MVLMPKRVKYRKSQRGRRKGFAVKGSKVTFGEYGLQATENGWFDNIQIEATRVAISRHIVGGRLWIRVFPDKSVTKKPQETRMGKGKGELEKWVCVVKKGRMLFEVGGIPEEAAREAFRIASHKVPLRTRMVARGGYTRGA